MPTSPLPLLLAVHIALALALVLPSIVLPFALRMDGRHGASASPVVRVLLPLQAHGTVVIGAGLALTGVGLIVLLGGQLLTQPWLVVALAIYATNLGLAFFVQRPNVRRLLGWSGGDEATWRARARRQRQVSYAMALLVGAIAVLMSAKPTFGGLTVAASCIFCRIVAGEIPATVVHETDDTLAFRDINPRAPVHVLVIPRRHIASLDALGPDEADLAARLLLAAGNVARQEGIAERGYRLISNVGAWGGQTVDHLHLHVMGGRPFNWPPG